MQTYILMGLLTATTAMAQASSNIHQALGVWANAKAMWLIEHQCDEFENKPYWISTDAWLDYQKGLEASGNQETMLADGMDVAAEPNGDTTIQFDLEQHQWHIEMPIVTTYKNAEWVQDHTMHIDMMVKAYPKPPLNRAEQFQVTAFDIELSKPITVNTYKAQFCTPPKER